jgi:hypothetical protein
MADETETQVIPETPELEAKLDLLREHNRLLAENSTSETKRWEEATAHNEEEIKQIEDSIAGLERKLRQGDKLEEADRKQLETGRKQIKLIKEQNKLHDQAVKAIHAHEQALEELNKDGENFANTLLGLNSGLGSFTKKLFGTKGGLKAFGKGLLGLLNPFKLLLSFITKVIESSIMMAVNLDKASTSFLKATGAAGKFGDQVADLGYAMRGTGVRAGEVAEAYGALYSTFVDFTKATGPQRAALTKTVAKLQELGVSAQLQAEIANEATRSLGFGFGEVEGVLRDVAGVAASLNEPFDKVMQNFATVSKKLAFYGTNIMGVFKKLSAQAKSTGLSIDELLGVVEQFDTFEGAGKAVGKLNAIMGGPYLNSIDMLNASEEERVEILKRSMKQSNMNFKDMGKYEQKMVASAMGIGVEQARKLFGAETEQVKMERLKQAQVDARVSRAQDIGEKMLNLMENLALNWMPWLKKIKDAIDKLGEWSRKLLDWWTGLSKGKKTMVLGGAVGLALLGPRLAKSLALGASRKVTGLAGRLALGKGGKGAPRGRRTMRAKILRGMGPKWRGRLGLQTAKKFKKPKWWSPSQWKAPNWMKPSKWKAPKWLTSLKPSKWKAPRWMISLKPSKWKAPAWLKPGAFGELLAKLKPQWLLNIMDFFKAPGMASSFLGAGSKLKLVATKIPVIGSVLEMVIGAIQGIMGIFQDTKVILGSGLSWWGKTKQIFASIVARIVQTFQFVASGILGFVDMVIGALTWLLGWIPGAKNKSSFGRDEQGRIGGQDWNVTRNATGLNFSDVQERQADTSALFGVSDEMITAGVGGDILGRGVDDFIYRGSKGVLGPGTITPIDKEEEFMGMKAGGAIHQALQAIVERNTGPHRQGKIPDAKQPAIINIHIGQKKIETIVLDSLDSTAGKKRLSPFMRA